MKNYTMLDRIWTKAILIDRIDSIGWPPISWEPNSLDFFSECCMKIRQSISTN